MGDPIYPDAMTITTFQDGLEFQDFVCEVLAREYIVLQNLCSRRSQFMRGENLQGFEIKLDQRCTETGRLSIEVAERVRNDDALAWTPSGIYRCDNTWLYVQGNSSKLWVFAKNWLIRYHRLKRPHVYESHGTVRKFYLPIDVADECAARVIIPC